MAGETTVERVKYFCIYYTKLADFSLRLSLILSSGYVDIVPLADGGVATVWSLATFLPMLSTGPASI